MLLVLNGKAGVKWSVLDAKVRFLRVSPRRGGSLIGVFDVGRYVYEAVPDKGRRWDAKMTSIRA